MPRRLGINAKANQELVQGGKRRSNVLMPFCASNERSSSIFDRLWRVEGGLPDTQEMCITVVKSIKVCIILGRQQIEMAEFGGPNKMTSDLLSLHLRKLWHIHDLMSDKQDLSLKVNITAYHQHNNKAPFDWPKTPGGLGGYHS